MGLRNGYASTKGISDSQNFSPILSLLLPLFFSPPIYCVWRALWVMLRRTERILRVCEGRSNGLYLDLEVTREGLQLGYDWEETRLVIVPSHRMDEERNWREERDPFLDQTRSQFVTFRKRERIAIEERETTATITLMPVNERLDCQKEKRRLSRK